jgi:single-strand DNA-binding protein
MNVVALVGRLTRPAEHRELPSGSHLLSYDVSITNPEGPAETVPVVWFDAPASAVCEVDEQVVVIGRVRRRFFRAGGATQSRTEVVADSVYPTRHKKRVEASLETARARLDEA